MLEKKIEIITMSNLFSIR